MGLLASESSGGGGDFAMTPEGQYTARCYRIIDLGTQLVKSPVYGDKEKHQVMISWELFGTWDEDQLSEDGSVKHKAGSPIVMDDGRPFSIHKTYTVSLAENSALRPHLEAWRGKKFTTEELAGFELSKVLGQYCTVQVVHDETGKYANVQTIMAFKGNKPEPVNPDLVFDIDQPDMQIFDTLSDNLKGKITNTPEWTAYQNPPKPTVTAVQQQQKDMGTLADEEINIKDVPF
jgi:hypothetical protein